MEVTEEGLARYFEVVLPHMNEVQRRVVAGAMAEALGRGGKTAVATASGMSRNTVIKAQGEIEEGIEPSVTSTRPSYFARINQAGTLSVVVPIKYGQALIDLHIGSALPD